MTYLPVRATKLSAPPVPLHMWCLVQTTWVALDPYMRFLLPKTALIKSSVSQEQSPRKFHQGRTPYSKNCLDPRKTKPNKVKLSAVYRVPHEARHPQRLLKSHLNRLQASPSSQKWVLRLNPLQKENHSCLEREKLQSLHPKRLHRRVSRWAREALQWKKIGAQAKLAPQTLQLFRLAREKLKVSSYLTSSPIINIILL